MRAARAALIRPFWDVQNIESEIQFREKIRAKVKRTKEADYCRVDQRGTVLAIVDGVVYYNTPSHREDELGI